MTLTFGRPRAAGEPHFGWHRLCAPDDDIAFVLAIPVVASLCSALVFGWILATPWTQFVIDQVRMIAGLALAVLAHELARIVAFPWRSGPRWMRAVCSRSRLALDTGYDGELSRNRLLAVLGAPFLLGSVLPLALCSALRSAPDFVVLFTLTNALLCGADALALLLVLAQVPGGALARIDGDVVRWTTARTAPPMRERMSGCAP